MLHPDHLSDLASPSFSGARCADEWQLFDLASGHGNSFEVIDARAAAIALCESCPVLQTCRAYFDSLPPRQRARGVIAGQMNNKRSRCTA